MHGIVGTSIGIHIHIDGGIEGSELAFLVGLRAIAGDATDPVYLKILGPGAVGNNMVFGETFGQVNPIRTSGKKIDGRCAK